MIINAAQVIEHLRPEAEVPVRHASGELAFRADYDRALELCRAQQVCGRCKGRTLRYLELLVPMAELIRVDKSRSRGGIVAEDSRTIEREGALISHDFGVCATYGPRLRYAGSLSAQRLLKMPAYQLRQAYSECAGV